MQNLMHHHPGPVRATPALQLWEAFHESKALALSLRSSVRAQSECQHLSELLESVSELLCFVFSRYNNSLFIGTLNSHVQSSAQLLEFGMLKVCRVVDSCCTTSSNPTRYSQASITSAAASAAADIQLAVTVLATAVQYLDTTCGKQSEAAVLQVSPGLKESQQQTLKAAALSERMRRSVGSQRQLAGEDADAVQIYTIAKSSAGDAQPASAAGNRCTAICWSESCAQQPGVATELTFVAGNVPNTAAENEPMQADMLEEDNSNEQQCREVESKEDNIPKQQALCLQTWKQAAAVQPDTAALSGAAMCSGTIADPAAAEPSDSAAYTTARLQALQELLKPGSTWCLEDNGANFVCSTRASDPQQQQAADGSLTAPAAQHLHPPSHTPCEQLQLRKQLQQPQKVDASPPAVSADIAVPAALEMPLAGELQDEFDPAYCNDIQSTKIPLTAEQLQLDGPELKQRQQQQHVKQEQHRTGQLSSTAWLQQQLQQVYSNALLQGRKQQLERHMMLRRSQELSHGVAAASEVLPSPKEQLQQQLQRKQQARAESPEPAGWGIGFVKAGFNSGNGNRSLRMSTEEMVEHMLGKGLAGGAVSAPGASGSHSLSTSWHNGRAAAAAASASGALAAASCVSAAAASEGFFVPYMKAASPDKCLVAGKARCASAPGSTTGSTRVSTRVSRESGGSAGSTTSMLPAAGMVSNRNARGYANRSGTDTYCSVSAAGSARSSREFLQAGSAVGLPGSTGVKNSNARGSGDVASGAALAGGTTVSSTNGSSNSPSSLKTSRDSSAAGAAASNSSTPCRYSSPGSSRQNRASQDSIRASSSPGATGLCGGGAGGNSSGRYYSSDETLTAAAASYASARSSFSSSTATSGLARFSSTGGTVMQGTHATGYVAQFRVSTGDVRSNARTCRVTSAAGAAVINLLAAAAAGAKEAVAGNTVDAGSSLAVLPAGTLIATIGSDVDWLCSAGSSGVRQSRRCSWDGRSSSSSSGSNSGEPSLHKAVKEHRCVSCPDAEVQMPRERSATPRAGCITAHGCLTLGSFDGASISSSRSCSSNGGPGPARSSSGASSSLLTKHSSLHSPLAGSTATYPTQQSNSHPASTSRGGHSASSSSSSGAGAGSRNSDHHHGGRDETLLAQQQLQQDGICPASASGQCSSLTGALKASQQSQQPQPPGSRGGQLNSNSNSRTTNSSADDDMVLDGSGLDAGRQGTAATEQKCAVAPAGPAASGTSVKDGAADCAVIHVEAAAEAQPTAGLAPLTAADADFVAAARQDTKQGRKTSAAGTDWLPAQIAAAAAAAAATGVEFWADPLEPNPVVQQKTKEQVDLQIQQSLTEVQQEQQSLIQQQQQKSRKAAQDHPAAGSHAAGAVLDAWQQQRQQWQQQWEQQQQLWQQQVKQREESRRASSSAGSAVVSREDSRCEQQPAASTGTEPVEGAATAAALPASECIDQLKAADTVVLNTSAAAAAQAESDEEHFGGYQGSDACASAVVAAVPESSSAMFATSVEQAVTGNATGQATAGIAAQLPLRCNSSVSLPVVKCAAEARKDVIPAAGTSDDTANRSSLMVHTSAAVQQQPQAACMDPTAGENPAAAVAAVILPATSEAAAEMLLAEGNGAYTAGRYHLAVQSYARALDKLGGSIASTSSEAGVLLWVKCSLNLACCNLRLGQYKQCVALCDGLLEVDPANIVALCHRGRALLMVQQHAAAKADLTEALQLLEDEAAEQQHQQQYHLAQLQQQQQQLLGQGVDSELDGTCHPLSNVDATAATAAVKKGNVAATEVDGAIRGSSRCLTPCTLARMRLNNSYWQHRVLELLAGTKD